MGDSCVPCRDTKEPREKSRHDMLTLTPRCAESLVKVKTAVSFHQSLRQPALCSLVRNATERLLVYDTEHRIALIRSINKEKVVRCLCMTLETTILVGVP